MEDRQAKCPYIRAVEMILLKLFARDLLPLGGIHPGKLTLLLSYYKMSSRR
jgi:hypothetical protein